MIVPSAGVSSLSDLPALAASRALVSNASGVIDVSAATATEAGYLSGVTSAIQTQLNAKAATTHQHSATTDITSGTLATAQGGRGRGNYTAANRVPYAASTTAETDSASLTFNGTTLSVGSCTLNSAGVFNITGSATWQVAAWDVLKFVSGNGVRFGGVTSSQWSKVECYASGSEVMRWTSGGLIIGGTSLDSSAALEVNSTTRGILPSRMTSTQRGLIASPAEGLVVYDTTLDALMVFDSTSSSWKRVVTGEGVYDLYVTNPAFFYYDAIHFGIIDFANGYALQALGGCIELDAAEAYYLGNKDTDGSWRHIRSGNDLLFQRRESSSWVTKQTISA